MLCEPIKNTHPHIMQRHFPSASPSRYQSNLDSCYLNYYRGILHMSTPHQQISTSHSGQTHHRLPTPWSPSPIPRLLQQNFSPHKSTTSRNTSSPCQTQLSMNKLSSDSSLNAFYRNSPTSSRPTSSTTSPPTTPTLTGNNGTDHLHPPLKISSQHFSLLSLTYLLHPAMPSSSAN
jgi:hypothetical protein